MCFLNRVGNRISGDRGQWKDKGGGELILEHKLDNASEQG